MSSRPSSPSTTTRPRLGFLGVGWIGRHRMQAIADSGAAEIAAIADPSQECVGAAAELAPGASRHRTLEELLEQPLDGVVIATPSALHAAQATRALDHGLAVFCQKPLARTAREARAVVDAARQADRLLGVDLSYRHTTAIQRIRSLIGEGALGDIYAANLVFHNAYGPDKPWFYDKASSGGGCVMDLGIHLVDLALWLLDFPELERVHSRLYSGGKALEGDSPHVEDYAAVQLELAGGTSVQLACSWRLPAGCDCVIEASFFGTGGGATLRNVNGSFYDFVAEHHQGTQRTLLAEPPDEWGGRAAVAWARNLAEGVRYRPEAERLIEPSRVLDAIYERDERARRAGR